MQDSKTVVVAAFLTLLLLPVAHAEAVELLVSSESTNNVLRYDGTTGAFIDVFASGGGLEISLPEGLALGPDGNLYVGSFFTNGVLRYDGTTGGSFTLVSPMANVAFTNSLPPPERSMAAVIVC